MSGFDAEAWRHWWSRHKRNFAPPDFPLIVCLCGSTRFKQEYIEANYRETMAGKIVLSVGWFSHADAQVCTLTEAEKKALDELHFRKVELADEVLVISDREGYFGDSTLREIQYALSLGKEVRWMEDRARQRFNAHAAAV